MNEPVSRWGSESCHTSWRLSASTGVSAAGVNLNQTLLLIPLLAAPTGRARRCWIGCSSGIGRRQNTVEHVQGNRARGWSWDDRRAAEGIIRGGGAVHVESKHESSAGGDDHRVGYHHLMRGAAPVTLNLTNDSFGEAGIPPLLQAEGTAVKTSRRASPIPRMAWRDWGGVRNDCSRIPPG